MNNKIQKLMSVIKIAAIPSFAVFCALSMSLMWFYFNITPEDMGSQWLASLVAICIIVLGAYQLVLLYANWIDAWISQKPSIIRSASIAVGFVALILLAATAMALSDVGHQTKAGLSSDGEWIMIFINSLVMLASLSFSHLSLPLSKKKRERPFKANDDVFYVTLNEVGILSSIMALCAIVFSFISPAIQDYRESVIFIFLVITLAPWGIMLVGWFLSHKKKVSRWWDEKQIQDMGRAALFTMITVVAASSLIYITGLIFSTFDASVIWFPSVLILSVMLFSGLNAKYSVW